MEHQLLQKPKQKDAIAPKHQASPEGGTRASRTEPALGKPSKEREKGMWDNMLAGVQSQEEEQQNKDGEQQQSQIQSSGGQKTASLVVDEVNLPPAFLERLQVLQSDVQQLETSNKLLSDANKSNTIDDIRAFIPYLPPLSQETLEYIFELFTEGFSISPQQVLEIIRSAGLDDTIITNWLGQQRGTVSLFFNQNGNSSEALWIVVLDRFKNGLFDTIRVIIDLKFQPSNHTEPVTYWSPVNVIPGYTKVVGRNTSVTMNGFVGVLTDLSPDIILFIKTLTVEA